MPDAVDPAAEVPDAARAALERARLAARDGAVVSRRSAAAPPRRRSQARFSGPGPDDRDPQSMRRVWAKIVSHEGWERPLDAAKVYESWSEIVGHANAEHTSVERFDAATGILEVRANSTAWAEQMRLMMPELRQRVERIVGPGVVSDIRILGPITPSWVKGRLRVKGRGPRDTYG